MSRRHNPSVFDWMSLVLYFCLVLIGCLMIYAVDYDAEAPASLFNFSTQAGKQLVFAFASLVVGGLIMLLDVRLFQTFAYLAYGILIIMLVVVIFVAATTKGANSWFELGPIKIQPSEFAKFATALALSAYLSNNHVKMRDLRSQLTAVAIFGLPMALVVLQGDTGSALVYGSFAIVLFREGMNPAYYILSISIAVLFALGLMYAPPHILAGILLSGALVLLALLRGPKFNWALAWAATLGLSIGLGYVGLWWPILPAGLAFVVMLARIRGQQRGTLVRLLAVGMVLASGFVFAVNYFFENILQPHQQERINVWLQPEKTDPLGARYNVTQSIIAIGSGGFEGKGFLNGTQTKLGYVPEQSTDFIFCTLGEEQGFVGSASVILMYLLLLLRITIIAERQRNKFARLYAYCVAGILSFHLLINVGMTVGLMPVIGIPLPFISYGGSSLLAFSILLAVLLKMDSNRLTVFR